MRMVFIRKTGNSQGDGDVVTRKHFFTVGGKGVCSSSMKNVDIKIN